MKNKEQFAYRGAVFAIEWFYDQQGYSQALDYFMNLSNDRQDRSLILFKRMGDSGRIFDVTKFRSEGDKIFAFKPKPDRFLCFFFTGKKIVITNAFEKKSQKLPQGEKAKALKAKSVFEDQARRGTYYGER